MDEATLKKKYKGRKIFLSICGVLIVLLLTLYFIATNNTQIVIGMLQKYRMAITRSIHTNHFMSH